MSATKKIEVPRPGNLVKLHGACWGSSVCERGIGIVLKEITAEYNIQYQTNRRVLVHWFNNSHRDSLYYAEVLKIVSNENSSR